MKLPNWFKILWWSGLSIALFIILSKRFEAISNGTATTVDAFLFLIFVILLLLPLFQEFDLFGIKLKSQLSDLRSDVKEQVSSLRHDILSIGINTQVSPNIYLTPPPDSQLPQIEEKFKSILKDTLNIYDLKETADLQTELLLPTDINYLFTIRYRIERELRRIWRNRFQDTDDRRPVPIFRMVQAL